MKKYIMYIFISLVCAFTGYFCYDKFYNKKAPEINYECKYQTLLLEKPTDGSSPLDHDVYKNLAYLMWGIKNEDEFSSYTSGSSNAFVANIDIYSKRIVKDGKAIAYSVSSGIVSFAEKRYFFDDKVLLQDKNKIDGFNTTWSNKEPDCITYNGYKNLHGSLPFETTAYIICQETILESSQVTLNDDGTYSLTIKLNPDIEYAPYWYAKEIQTTSGSKSLPKFLDIEITYTFNENWQILTSEVYEKYKVRAVGIEAVTETNCTEYFSYENINFDESDLSYIDKYQDKEPSDELVNKEDDVLTMITSSLQNQDGSPKNLALNLQIDDVNLEGILSLNIQSVDQISLLAQIDQLYFEYSDAIYLRYQNLKFRLPNSYLSQLFSYFSNDNESNELVDLSQIINQLNNSQVEKFSNGSQIRITTNLNVFDINLPIVFLIEKNQDNYQIQSIQSQFNLLDHEFKIELTNTNQTLVKDDKSDYQNLENLDFVIKDITSIINQKELAGELNFNYQDQLKINGAFQVEFKDVLKIQVNLNIIYQEYLEELQINYQNETIYLSYEGIKVKISLEDLKAIISKYTDQEITTTNISVETIIKTLLSIDYQKLVQDLKIEENQTSLTLALNQLVEGLSSLQLTIENQENLTLEAIYEKMTLNLTLKDKVGEIHLSDQDYQNLGYLDFLIAGLEDIVKNKVVSGDISFKINDIFFKGETTIDFRNQLGVKLVLNISSSQYQLNENISLVYLDEYLYLDYHDFHFKFHQDDLMKLIDINNLNLTDNLLEFDWVKTFLSIDFSKLIKGLEIEENSLSINLDLSRLLSDLNDLQIAISQSLEGNLNISLNLLDMLINLKDNQGSSIEIGDYSYLDMGNYLILAKDLSQMINKESINLKIDQGEINFKLNTQEIKAKLLVDLNLILTKEKKYEIDGTLILKITNCEIKVDYYFDKESNLYLSVLNQTFKINLEEKSLVEYVNSIVKKVNELSSEEIVPTIETNLSNNLSINEILSLVDKMVFSENSINLDLQTLLNEVSKVALSFSKLVEMDGYLFNLDFVYSNLIDVKLPLFVTSTSLTQSDFLINHQVNITSDNLYNLVSTLVDSINLNTFYLQINTSLIKNQVVIANVNGILQISIHDRVNNIFDLDLELNIQEFDLKSQPIQNHLVKLTYLSKKTMNSNQGYLYAKYGNAQYDLTPNSFIKVKMEESGIIAFVDSLIDFISSDAVLSILNLFIEDLDIFNTAKEESNDEIIDLNTLISPIIFSDNQIDVSLYSNKLFNNGNQSLNISLSLYNGLIEKLKIENLYLSYIDNKNYQKFETIEISLYHPKNSDDLDYIEKINISIPEDENNYTYDLTNLHYLVEAISNTFNEEQFEAQGSIDLSLAGLINFNVGLNVKVVTVPTLKMQIYFDVPSLNTIIYGKVTEKDVYIYYQDEIVYINRIDKDGSQYKIKMHYTSFSEDLLYWLLKYSLGIPDGIYNMMIGDSSSTSEENFVSASECINKLEFNQYSSTIGLNLKILTGNENIGDLEATLNAKELISTKTKEKELMLYSISQFSMKFVNGLVSLNSEEILLINFTEEGIKNVDMNQHQLYLEEVENDELDRYYQYENGQWVKKNKLDHSLTFNLIYKDNIQLRYAEGDLISLPDVDKIITFEDDKGMHYYQFDGWYMDKDYQVPYNLTYMPSKKTDVYAKWKDITVKIIISETLFNEEYIYTTYQGASLDRLYNLFDVYQDGNKIYTITSFSLDDELFLDNIAEKDLILTPNWEEVIFHANVDGNLIELDFNNKEPIVNQGQYMILIDQIYYIISADSLTSEILYNDYYLAFDDDYVIDIYSYQKIEGYYSVNFELTNSKFNNKSYNGIMLLSGTYLTSEMLPNGQFSYFEINSWKDQNNVYYNAKNINLLIDQNYQLSSYVSVRSEYFNYNNDALISFNEKYSQITNSIEHLILPMYSSYNVKLTKLSFLIDASNNSTGGFNSNQVISKIVIPDGYVEIADNYFKNIKNLKEVYLSDSIKLIGTYSFMYDSESSFENNRDLAVNVRLYFSNNSSYDHNSNKLVACKWNTSERKYGEKGNGFLGLGKYDFSSTYQNYNGNILEINKTILSII